MSNTNHTPNYDLPLFIPEDKPSWLGSWNDAMTKIDGGIKGSSQQGDANATGILNNKTSIEGLEKRMDGAEGAIKDQNTRIQELQTYGSIFLPYSTPFSYVVDEVLEEENNYKASINSWTGGFLSVNIADEEMKEGAGYNVTITQGDVILHEENGYYPASNTGFNVTSDPFLIPPRLAISVLVSVDNKPVSNEKVNILNTPYRSYPMAFISNVTPAPDNEDDRLDMPPISVVS